MAALATELGFLATGRIDWLDPGEDLTAAAIGDALGEPVRWEAPGGAVWPTRWHYRGLALGFEDGPAGRLTEVATFVQGQSGVTALAANPFGGPDLCWIADGPGPVSFRDWIVAARAQGLDGSVWLDPAGPPGRGIWAAVEGGAALWAPADPDEEDDAATLHEALLHDTPQRIRAFRRPSTARGATSLRFATVAALSTGGAG